MFQKLLKGNTHSRQRHSSVDHGQTHQPVPPTAGAFEVVLLLERAVTHHSDKDKHPKHTVPGSWLPTDLPLAWATLASAGQPVGNARLNQKLESPNRGRSGKKHPCSHGNCQMPEAATCLPRYRLGPPTGNHLNTRGRVVNDFSIPNPVHSAHRTCTRQTNAAAIF